MYFTKMQANGNDYIYMDLHEQTLRDPKSAAIRLSDRHFGIGGDGLVLLCPSACADFRMRIFDPDGTEAEMCGNALQSAGMLYALSGCTDKNCLTVETLAGRKQVFLVRDGKTVKEVSAEIGSPIVRFVGRNETVGGKTFSLSYISFGNPHCVVRTDDLSDETVTTYGPLLERHPLFPERANVEFLSVTDRCHFRMRTWERGCGETLSCSTGSAAALVAAVLLGEAETEAEVVQRGGSIRVRWDRDIGSVRIFGKAQVVFRGYYEETE